jgi:GNAT superfamily N-acetyltransferase
MIWFSEQVTEEAAKAILLGVPEDQRFAVELPDSDVDPRYHPGIYGVRPMQLSVPDGEGGGALVPVGGLTWVGVHPDHRRRGLLTAMMRQHFEQTRSEGVHVSALHASEPAIYGRHGYGPASLELEVKLGRGTTLTAPHLEEQAARVTTRMGTVTDPDMPKRMRECHLTVGELGSVVGEIGYYARLCQLWPEHLRDKEPWRILFARRDGVDVGFALFRRSHHWERGRPSGEVQVWTLQGDPTGQLVLLRRLLDLDLMGTVKLHVGVDDPLLAWVGGPRAASDVATYDNLWVRLVDLPEALEERAWTAPCDVAVEVSDRGAPWNEGVWRIRARDDGRAAVERTTDAPDLRLDVEALGAAYLGAGNLAALHRAGLVAEARPGAVAELWRAMRTDLAPAAAVGF